MSWYRHLLIICLLFLNIISSAKEISNQIKFSKEEFEYLKNIEEDVVYINQDTRVVVNGLCNEGVIKEPENSLLQFCKACQADWKIVSDKIAKEATDQLLTLTERNKDKFTEEKYRKVNSVLKRYQKNLAGKDAQFFFDTKKFNTSNTLRTFNDLVVDDIVVKNLLQINQTNGSLALRAGKDDQFGQRVVSRIPVNINFQPTEGSPNSLVVIGTTVVDDLTVTKSQNVRGNLNVGGDLTISQASVIINANNVGGGVEVFKNKSGNIINFKTLTAGNNISINASNDQITISAVGLGDVTSSTASTDNAIVRYNGTTGKIIQNSGIIIDDSNNLSTSGQINAAQFNLSTLPSSSTSGLITQGTVRFIHNSSSATNFFGGIEAGSFSSTSSFNTGLGNRALNAIVNGSNNTSVGSYSLFSSTTGSNNTAVGSQSLQNNAIGTGNIALGVQAGINVTGSNNIHIGNIGSVADVSTIRIGNNQTSCFIAGINGATSPAGTSVFVSSDGELGTLTSSIRYKKDIKDITDQTDKIAKLKPVTFKYKFDKQNTNQYGLVAENVKEIFPDMVNYNKDGQPENVKYHFLPILLLASHQRMQKEVQELKMKIQKLEAHQKRS